MRPKKRSQTALKVTQSHAKMFEYSVPPEARIELKGDPAELFSLAIGMLGDAAAQINRGKTSPVDESKNIQFSARFFNAYFEGRFRDDTDAYLLLFASAAFYLSHVPGSSLVLAKKVSADAFDLQRDGLERLLLWLLIGASGAFTAVADGLFAKEIQDCADTLVGYYAGETKSELCMAAGLELRSVGYAVGSPLQLLLADICAALIQLRIQNSARYWLPLYSNLPLSKWEGGLNKGSFPRELWPSQQFLGEKGVYKGASAIVQMPTSAGKTRATELIIRSAFLANRTVLAVIVAPFRALCHEISDAFKEAFRGEPISVDELTDVLQPDFDFLFLEENFQFIESKRVLVVTPEKLLYVLRHEPELAASIGLIIYDEGHQFDSGIRGVTYELLLTSLRSHISKDAQTVLISAVISNAEAIGAWLLGEKLTLATGANLSPMQRRVAFMGWSKTLGQLHFMEEDALETEDFFVPRLVSQQPLKKRGKETKVRLFPEKGDSNSIALYLGIKLVNKGSVAVFCGRKDTVAGICEDIVEAYDRELSLQKPLAFSNQEEIARLTRLYGADLGADASSSRAAGIGVLSHNGNTPHGVRLAVEHAMKEGDAKFIVCTSTLAQGVNLPIRYLIVTSVYQGGEQIKVRDFHNLIGRAGRAGMHVEGTILFADPKIYDGRSGREDSWRWPQAQQLLNHQNSEPVVSSIQSLFEPFKSDDGRTHIKLDLVEVARRYTANKSELQKTLEAVAAKNADKKFTVKGLAGQAQWKFKIFAAIESYLMAYWEDSEGGGSSRALAEGTLAYALVSNEQQRQLVELFGILAEHVRSTVPDVARRAVFARTLQGVTANLELEKWVTEQLETLKQIESHEELLKNLWPMIAEGIDNKTFQKIDKPEAMVGVALSWISGTSFGNIFNALKDEGIQLHHGKTRRSLTVEHVVDICEGAFGYDGALRIGAVTDLIASQDDDDDARLALVERLAELHKRFKYGLPQTSAVALYESGFADRVVAQHLSSLVGNAPVTRSVAISTLAGQLQAVETVLDEYPKYFQTCLAGLFA